MRRVARAGAALALLLAGCETTGNPREGGLFGWSETKARERQAERREQVSAAEARLQGEHRRGDQLRARDDSSNRQLAAAAAENRETHAKLRARENALRAKAANLETVSPTAASASRARQLRMRVEEVLADRVLTPLARARQLRELESEIDTAAANLAR